MRKPEFCVKCGREYDGSYPCPCGSKDFTDLKPKEKKSGEKLI